jgi:hypothetical protein
VIWVGKRLGIFFAKEKKIELAWRGAGKEIGREIIILTRLELRAYHMDFEFI